ncbi:spartin isoform X3 [Sagmatias obliquidens]|uniref:spartin isoform X3 n=1 Tax=Sagmatias obliquidens TaxID=3371155 RepID=UPI000F43FE4B|nr:spartin isoform X3 [Lagenorhynchus obliquidens]
MHASNPEGNLKELAQRGLLLKMEQEPQDGEPAEIKIIKEAYKKAFLFVNKGLNTDELGQKEEAKNYYKQGIGHLLRGISISSADPEHIGPGWESARQMQQKMKETLQNVRTRLEILEKGLATSLRNDLQEVPKLYPEFPPKDMSEKSLEPQSFNSLPQHNEVNGNTSTTSTESVSTHSTFSLPSQSHPSEAPPAYTPQAAEGHYTVSYGTESGEFSSVGENFYRNHSQPPPLETLGLDADELILIPNGVQIFFVNPAGEVSAPSYPGYLRIVRFLDNSLDTVLNRPPGFLQVCDWLYPLVPDRSPVLKCTIGAYMFPDTMLQASGCFVGVVLSSELPEDDRELFEDLLRQMSDLRLQANWDRAEGENEFQIPGRSRCPSNQLKEASGIEVRQLDPGSKDVRHKGKRGKKTKGTSSEEVNLSHIVPYEPVSEEKAKELPEWSEKVAQNILSVDGVCTVANCVGKELAPHVKKHGSKLVPESLKKDKNGKSTLDGAMVVAASSVQGFSTVWQGLECAAKCIVNNVSVETVQTVRYKYGHTAGEATHNAVDSAINVGVTAYNIDNVGIKAMVKKTAKQTGHTLLEDYKIVDNSKGENQGGGASVNMKEAKDEQREALEKDGAKKKDK